MGAHRASITAVSAVAGAVLLVSLLVTWASSIGPDQVLAGDGPATHRVTPSEETTSISASVGGKAEERPPPADARDHPVLAALAVVLLVVFGALALTGLVLLGRRLWDRWQLRSRPPPPEAQVDFDPLETPRRVAEEIVRDAPTQRELLEQGSPRNAIVACWQRFEEQAAAAGVRRRRWETSAEFTLRILDLVDAESHQVARLAALFREARFSDHPLGEPARAEALAALDAIHDGLFVSRGGDR